MRSWNISQKHFDKISQSPPPLQINLFREVGGSPPVRSTHLYSVDKTDNFLEPETVIECPEGPSISIARDLGSSTVALAAQI
jgi:hypothetical protein